MAVRRDKRDKVRRFLEIEYEGKICECGHGSFMHDNADYLVNRNNPMLGQCNVYVSDSTKCSCHFFRTKP